MAKKLPEYNASSLADIAFMLLIFFLVTTTMDIDSGLERRLPQWVDPKDIEETPPIKERNVFVVLVDRNDRLMVENQIARVDDLKEKTKEFLTNPYNLPNMPEKYVDEVPYFGTMELISKSAVISLRNDIGTTYGTYIQVQNELIAAINELREDLAKSKFGKSYKDLDVERQDAIKIIYPQKISEAEPRKAGGR